MKQLLQVEQGPAQLTLLAAFVNERIAALNSTYKPKDQGAVKQMQATGVLMNQDELERLISTCCLEDMLARTCTEDQLRSLVGNELLLLHPAFLFHLVVRYSLPREESLACIDKFLLSYDLYATDKLG